MTKTKKHDKMKKGKKNKIDNYTEGKKNNGNNKSLIITGGVILIVAVAVFIMLNLSNNNKKYDNPQNSERSKVEESAFHFTKMGELTFLSKAGKIKAKIDIEIAETNESRAQGLMYRDKMKENQGMLFIFAKEQMQSFWMKNTIIPLDIIFINAKKKIVNIQKNTTPYSLDSYPSIAPAKYVLEVNAGFTGKYKIEPGDKILWRRI